MGTVDLGQRICHAQALTLDAHMSCYMRGDVHILVGAISALFLLMSLMVLLHARSNKKQRCSQEEYKEDVFMSILLAFLGVATYVAAYYLAKLLFYVFY